MKQIKVLTALVAITLLTAAPVLAQPAPLMAGPPPHEGPHGGPGGRLMEDADTNKDGFLTKDEMRAAQDKRLDEMFVNVDTNKDGKLSKEELTKGREAMHAKMQERMKQHRESAPQ